VYTYKLGKEEILVKLAEKYETKCVVSSERYKWINLANYHPNLFTDTPTPRSFLYGKTRDEFRGDLCLPEQDHALLMVSGRGLGKPI